MSPAFTPPSKAGDAVTTSDTNIPASRFFDDRTLFGMSSAITPKYISLSFPLSFARISFMLSALNRVQQTELPSSSAICDTKPTMLPAVFTATPSPSKVVMASV